MSETKQTTPTNGNNRRQNPEFARTPYLLEFVFTLAKIVVIVIASLVGVFSYQSGSPVWIILVRVCLSVFVVGCISWLVCWFIARGYLDAVLTEKNEKNQQEFSKGTMELQA